MAHDKVTVIDNKYISSGSAIIASTANVIFANNIAESVLTLSEVDADTDGTYGCSLSNDMEDVTQISTTTVTVGILGNSSRRSIQCIIRQIWIMIQIVL